MKKNKIHKKFVNLLHDFDHFNLITSITAFFGCKYYCEACKVKYSNLTYHLCENLCKSCSRYHYICLKEKVFICKACNIISLNKFCYDLHRSSQCKFLSICNDCNYPKPKRHGHVCKIDEKWCINCKESVNIDHKCYIKKNDSASTKKKKKLAGKIYFDIEAFVNSKNFHEANLIMAKRVCKKCELTKILCTLCKIKYEFTNIEAFVRWVLKKSNKNFIFISQNGKFLTINSL